MRTIVFTGLLISLVGSCLTLAAAQTATDSTIIELPADAPAPQGVTPPVPGRLGLNFFQVHRTHVGQPVAMTFRVLVLEDGTISDVQTKNSSGNPSLDAMGIEYEKRHWAGAKPALKDGQPIKVWADSIVSIAP